MLYFHSRAANPVNIITAILQRGCSSWNGLVVQLCLPILSFQSMMLTPLKSQQEPWSLYTDKKQRILLRSNQTLQVQVTEAASECTRVSWGLTHLFPAPSFSWWEYNPWKIQTHLNTSNFPISATCLVLVSFVLAREPQFCLDNVKYWKLY